MKTTLQREKKLVFLPKWSSTKNFPTLEAGRRQVHRTLFHFQANQTLEKKRFLFEATPRGRGLLHPLWSIILELNRRIIISKKPGGDILRQKGMCLQRHYLLHVASWSESLYGEWSKAPLFLVVSNGFTGEMSRRNCMGVTPTTIFCPNSRRKSHSN